MLFNGGHSNNGKKAELIECLGWICQVWNLSSTTWFGLGNGKLEDFSLAPLDESSLQLQVNYFITLEGQWDLNKLALFLQMDCIDIIRVAKLSMQSLGDNRAA